MLKEKEGYPEFGSDLHLQTIATGSRLLFVLLKSRLCDMRLYLHFGSQISPRYLSSALIVR